jgi:energy-coupling factor transport system permease protein
VTSPARLLHPAAWWVWALCLAYAAMRTSDPLLLLTIAATAGFVVSARRGNAPWANAYGLLLKLGVLTVVVTMALQALIGVRVPGHVLVTLPSMPLPSWAGGLSLGGSITGEALLNACSAGLRLAVLIACFGAANALAHPARLVRILPAALYEVGVAVVVAMTFVPQLAESVARVRAAQRLRGRPITGVRGLRGIVVPVLEEALERAISLAASMDSRGYGRRAEQARSTRLFSSTVLLLGLAGAVAGTYQVIGGGDHTRGLVILTSGTVVAVAGGFVARGRGRRTRYRPDHWRWPEWLVVACGATAALAYQFTVTTGPSAGVPFAWPHCRSCPSSPPSPPRYPQGRPRRYRRRPRARPVPPRWQRRDRLRERHDHLRGRRGTHTA